MKLPAHLVCLLSLLLFSCGREPVPDITFYPEEVNAGEDVTFTTAYGNGTGTYDWDFGDGTKLYNTTASVQHRYLTDGTYLVAAVITDSSYASFTAGVMVTVLP
jgi:PKD repeat protein